MRSSDPGRELVRLGRRGGQFSLPVAAGSGSTWRSAGHAEAGSAGRSRACAAQTCQIAVRTREIVASTI